MFTRTCALKGCDVEFHTDNRRKKFHSLRCQNLAKVRRWRRNRPKGGGGGGNGGGGGPTLFDELVPIDPQAIVLTGIRYRTPPVERKPVEPVRLVRHRKAA